MQPPAECSIRLTGSADSTTEAQCLSTHWCDCDVGIKQAAPPCLPSNEMCFPLSGKESHAAPIVGSTNASVSLSGGTASSMSVGEPDVHRYLPMLRVHAVIRGIAAMRVEVFAVEAVKRGYVQTHVTVAMCGDTFAPSSSSAW